MDRVTIQRATAICDALGMPTRFAAEKPPVSPTLRGTLAAYMRELGDESLRLIAAHGSPLAKQAAQTELAQRAEGKEVPSC